LFFFIKVTDKSSGRKLALEVYFDAYPTSQFRSGAYLFKPDATQEENVSVFTASDLREVVVMSGPVFSEVSAVYESGVSKSEPGSFVHTLRLYHTGDGIKDRAVYVENNFSFGDTTNHHDVDLFMRLKSGVKNGERPVFYTDMNGLQMQKRNKIESIGIEGNYYPIASKAYIEDDEWRVGLAVDHAQGASAWQEGWLEVMVDRRSTFDDARGMGEGVLDNRETNHKYWLTIEPSSSSPPPSPLLPAPSQLCNTLSRYLDHPSVQFVSSDEEVQTLQSPSRLLPKANLVKSGLDCDMHLFNLRTLSDSAHPSAPSRKALMILHRQGRQCGVGDHGGTGGTRQSVFKQN
jgi:alpha-mannosidase